MMKDPDPQDVVDADVLQLAVNPHGEVKLRRAGRSVVAQDRLLVKETDIALDSAACQGIVVDPRVAGQLVQVVDSCTRSEDTIARAVKAEAVAQLGRRNR